MAVQRPKYAGTTLFRDQGDRANLDNVHVIPLVPATACEAPRRPEVREAHSDIGWKGE